MSLLPQLSFCPFSKKLDQVPKRDPGSGILLFLSSNQKPLFKARKDDQGGSHAPQEPGTTSIPRRHSFTLFVQLKLELVRKLRDGSRPEIRGLNRD